MATWESLSSAQRTAALHGDGPAACHAGPGSGKTRVVTLRAARLAERGARVLVTTFTRDATAEMKARIARLTPRKIPGAAHVTTVHALCLAILRAEDRKFDLITEESRRQGLAEAALAMELECGVAGFLTRASYLKNTGESAAAYRHDGSWEDREFARVWRAFEKLKAQQNLREFDDLLLDTRDLLRDESARGRWAAKYTHILVDECQDMNRPQFEIVLALGRDHQNVMLVGDPDQTLYSFRGADSETFRQFSAHSSTNLFELRENYRSTPSIISFAGALIRQDANRRPLALVATRPDGPEVRWIRCADAESESATVAEEVQRLADAGARFRDIAVLFRLNAQAEAFQRRFATLSIPFTMREDGDFYARKEIAGMLAYLEFFTSRADEWLLAFLNLPSRKLSRQVAAALRTTAEFRNRTIWEILPDFHAPDLKAHRAVRQMLQELRHVEERLPGIAHAGEAVRLIRRTMEFDAWLKREEMDDRDNDRIQNLTRMEEAAAGYRTIAAYLAAIRKVREEMARRKAERAKKQAEVEAVTLATGHAAKGLEWRFVFAAGWSEDLLPHRKALAEGGEEALAEERRIAYVMATRARDYLCVTSLDSWADSAVRPSRFLTGLNVATAPASESLPEILPYSAPESPALGGLFAG